MGRSRAHPESGGKKRAAGVAPAPDAAAIEAALIRHIGESSFQKWFAKRTHFRFEDGELVLGVSTHFLQSWLKKRFGADLQTVAKNIVGHTTPVRFVIDAELFQAARAEQEAVKAAAESKSSEKSEKSPKSKHGLADLLPPEPPQSQPRFAERPPSSLFEQGSEPPRVAKPARTGRRWHSLNDFVVGPSSRVAFAAAQSIVESPGQGPNPLVIHGPVGTGKTHLLEGIYLGLRRSSPEDRVCFVTAEDFTNRFVQALRNSKLAGFRKYYRELDALLLDDLNFLATKKASQEEFLHTFDSLQSDGRLVAVTCDCHPRLTDDFLPELADRLVGGAVWGLQPPDAATRLAILRSKAAKANALIDEKVLKFLADQLRGNVRELEGALNSLRHFAKVTGRPVDVTLAREALGDLLRHAVRVVSLADVDAAVCHVLRLPAGTLQGKTRTWSVSHPRMLAVFLARKHTAHSYGEVGQFFGGRNHSTAVAAEKRVRQWLDSDDQLSFNQRPWRVRELIEMAERQMGR